jgi:hypothetical protein
MSDAARVAVHPAGATLRRYAFMRQRGGMPRRAGTLSVSRGGDTLAQCVSTPRRSEVRADEA